MMNHQIGCNWRNVLHGLERNEMMTDSLAVNDEGLRAMPPNCVTGK